MESHPKTENYKSKSKDEEENIPNNHLVIACGTNCVNHKGWLSIDKDETANPHIVLDLINLAQNKLPSSSKPLHKLSYTPLSVMLDVCRECVQLYAATEGEKLKVSQTKTL